MFRFEKLDAWQKAGDFARFVEIAYGSLMEVVSQAQVAFHQGFLKQDERDALYVRAEELACMLSGLKASLLRPKTFNS